MVNLSKLTRDERELWERNKKIGIIQKIYNGRVYSMSAKKFKTKSEAKEYAKKHRENGFYTIVDERKGNPVIFSRGMYYARKPEGKFSMDKAHFLDAHPDILAEMSMEKKKKWEERINYARTRSHLKPYTKAGWKKFYKEH